MKHFDSNPDVSDGLEDSVSARERREKTLAIRSSLPGGTRAAIKTWELS